MGHRRQIERAARHASGDFDAKKASFKWQEKPQKPFNVRMFFVDVETGLMKKSWCGGTALLERRISHSKSHAPANYRYIGFKRSPHSRWVKPEHPIAMRRRIKREQMERLAAKRIPVV